MKEDPHKTMHKVRKHLFQETDFLKRRILRIRRRKVRGEDSD